MQITILGASGKVGSQLVKALLQRGHIVTALVHSSKKDLGDNPKLKVISGDVHSKEDIEAAITGSDVVVSTLGSWGTKTKDIVATASTNVVSVLHNTSSKRFVTLTGSAAFLPAEKPKLLQSLSHSMLKLVAKRILFDSEEHLKILSASNINWTSLRSPNMTNKKSASYKLSMTPAAPWATISRKAVVSAMVEIIENDNFSKQAPFISSK